MRIDPKGTIRGYSTLLVRQTLRRLRGFVWGEEALERAAKLPPGTGRALARALEAEGLIEASRQDRWTVTQAGDTLSVATAARPVSRQTAERALAQFLERVARVNGPPASGERRAGRRACHPGAALRKFPRRAILLVFGDIPVSERAEPSDFPGRL